MFHPQPWILTRRTLHDPESSLAKVPDTLSSSQSRSVEEDDKYFEYATPQENDKSEASRDSHAFRSQEYPVEGEPGNSESSEFQPSQKIDQNSRSRYRDEPLGVEEDDEEVSYDFRENQNQQNYYDHSPYPYEDQPYNEESTQDDAEPDNSAGYEESNLQLETNSEPYDDEVAASEKNNNEEVYSLEYNQNQDSTSKDASANNESTSKGSEQSSKESDSSKAREDDEGESGSEEDDYYGDDDYEDDGDYNDDDDFYDDGGGKGKGKKGKRRGGDDKKKVTAPFWQPQDYLLGSAKGGEGWAVQGPPVYFDDGEPQWPPEPHGGGKGRKGGKGRGDKGDKGGKEKGGKGGKGKKGKKGGGRDKKRGWGHNGWAGWERIGQGGWGEWPKGWISSTNLDTGAQRWVQGKGWVGETGVSHVSYHRLQPSSTNILDVVLFFLLFRRLGFQKEKCLITGDSH